MHKLVAETRVAQGQEAREWGEGEFLGVKFCLNGCHLLKDETKKQGQRGPARALEVKKEADAFHEFPQWKRRGQDTGWKS